MASTTSSAGRRNHRKGVTSLDMAGVSSAMGVVQATRVAMASTSRARLVMRHHSSIPPSSMEMPARWMEGDPPEPMDSRQSRPTRSTNHRGGRGRAVAGTPEVKKAVRARTHTTAWAGQPGRATRAMSMATTASSLVPAHIRCR